MKRLIILLSWAIVATAASYAQGVGADSLRLRSSSGGAAWLLLPQTATQQYRLLLPSSIGASNNQLLWVNGVTGQISVLPPGTIGQVLQITAGGLVWTDPASLLSPLIPSNAWSLVGNSGTNPLTNFLGTTDAQPLVIRVGNQETFRFNAPGNSAPAWSIQRGGGNQRGLHAVDLQSSRSAATQVASGNYSVIAGGQNNTASGFESFVGGGSQNIASGVRSFVGGGYSNIASGSSSFVGGGQGNTTSGDYSAIPGGYNLRIGARSFGFSGQTSGTQTDLSASSNIAAFVDVDLWLYNVRNQASQLRLYEPSGAGTNYTAFRAQAQASDIVYTLPASLTPTTTVAAGILQTDGSGNLSWVNTQTAVTTFAWSLIGNSGTNPSTNFLGTTDAQPLVLRTSNQERLRITSGGAVGIGTTAPLSLLDIAGGVAIGSFAGTSAAPNNGLIVSGNTGIGIASPNTRLHIDGGTGSTTAIKLTNGTTSGTGGGDGFNIEITSSRDARLVQYENASLSLYTNGTEYARLLSSGDLRLFGVAGTSGGKYLSLENNNGVASQLRFEVPDNTVSLGSYTAFQAGNHSGTNYIYTLPIDIPAVGDVLKVVAVSNSGANYFISLAWDTTQGTASSPVNRTAGTGFSPYLAYWTNDSTIASADYLYWDAVNKRIGLGNFASSSAPQYMLHLRGSSAPGSGDLFIQKDGTTGARLYFGTPNLGSNWTAFRAGSQSVNLDYTLPTSGPTNSGNGTNRFALATDNGNSTSPSLQWVTFWSPLGNAGVTTGFIGTTDNNDLRFRTNNTQRMVITNTGNVGIATTTPLATLDVNGTANVSGNTSIGGNLSVSGSTIAFPNIPSASSASDIVVWNSGNLERRSASGLVSGNAWSLTGNSGTNPSTNFLGTTDGQPLVIRVGNQEALRFNPGGLSIQRAGGNARGQYAVDFQGVRAAATQVASGDYSAVVSGQNNTASGQSSFVGSGYENSASTQWSAVVGGSNNTASGQASFVGSGNQNSASTQWSAVVGGSNNTASGQASFVGGGYQNTANTQWSAVAGGSSNTASGQASFVGGGYQNTASTQWSTVAGGSSNIASGQASFVGGGYQNSATGQYAAIAGGYGLQIGDRSFGYSGASTAINLSSSSNIAAFVDVDLWLYNVRNQASQLRLYEPSGSGTNFTAFRAQAQASDIVYTLPAAAGSPGQVLSIQSVSGSNVTLQWGNASGVATLIRKTSDQTVTSSTTYQNDNALVYSASANQVFEFEAHMFISGGDGGIKIRVNIPTGATMKLFAELKGNTAWSYQTLTSSTDEVTAASVAGTANFARIRGIITMGSSGGNVQIQWAQNSSNATGTTVEAGSYLKITPVQ